MKTEILSIGDQLLASAFDGTWQGMLITLLVALALKLVGPTNAATRHAVWLGTLAVCVLLIPGQFLAHLTERQLAKSSSAKTSTDDSLTLAEAGPRSTNEHFNSPSRTVGDGAAELRAEFGPFEVEVTNEVIIAGMGQEATLLELNTPSEETSRLPISSLIAVEIGGSCDSPLPDARIYLPGPENKGPAPRNVDLVAQTSSDLAVAPGEKPERPTEVTTVPGGGDRAAKLSAPGKPGFLRHPWNLPFALPRGSTLVLVLLWMCISVPRLVLLAWRVLQLRRIKRDSRPAPEELSELFDTLKSRAGIKRNVVLRLSKCNHPPALLGFTRPMVVVPQALCGLPQADSILRHELAHARRYDDWVNLGQNTIQALLFFHPAVHWISRRLTLEREISCDDHVLQEGTPRAYALLLANLADRFQGSRSLPAPGAATSRSQLHQRIDMILNTKRNASPRLLTAKMGILTTALAALAALAVYCSPRIVLAQENPDALQASKTPRALPVASPAPQPSKPADVFQPNATPVVADEDPNPKYKPDGLPAMHPPQPVPAIPATPRLDIAAVPVPPAPAPPGAPSEIIGKTYGAGGGYGGVYAVGGGHGGAYGASANNYVDSAGVSVAGNTGHASHEASLEARMARVEKMLQELLAQRGKTDYAGKSADDMKKEMGQIKIQQEQAAREAKMAAKRAEEVFSIDKDGKRKLKAQKDDTSAQLKALQRAREMLEKQMEHLDRQIEKLEEQQEQQENAEEDAEAAPAKAAPEAN